MTTPNFVKLQILYAISELHKNNIVANSFNIAASLNKNEKQIWSNLSHLVKFRYVKQTIKKGDGCHYNYIIAKNGKSVLPKLLYRASHFLELKLHKIATPRRFHPSEKAWIQENLIKSTKPPRPLAKPVIMSQKPTSISIKPEDVDLILMKALA